MSQVSFAFLGDRRVLRIGGADAEHFLQNLVTCDLEKLGTDNAVFGALLTPQGKIQFDFFITRDGESFLLDAPESIAAELAKRLTFYRLRAKVDIEQLGEDTLVAVSWGAGSTAETTVGFADPRLDALGHRHIGERAELASQFEAAAIAESSSDAYHAHRIGSGVPEALKDFDYSDIFPHDADMDQLEGVSFKKGCYVGQEVVSRMQHRSTARKRFIQVKSAATLPEKGTDILASGKSIGTLGSSQPASDASGSWGLALVRLDKAKSSLDKGDPISCGDADIELHIPSWAQFSWPVSDEQ